MGYEDILINLLAGPKKVADGAVTQARAGLTGELITGNAHGFYSELSSRGGIFCVSTAVAGVAPGTALGTTPPMALWNPPGSGVMLNVLRVTLGYVSGTLGAGTLLFAQVPGQVAAPTSGTKLTPTNNKTGSTANCNGQAYQGSTVVATPTLIKPSIISGAFVGGANNIGPVVDQLDGMISVAPGTAFVVQGLMAAGSSPLVLIAVEWEETVIPTAPA